jgi:hypothetical protein
VRSALQLLLWLSVIRTTAETAGTSAKARKLFSEADQWRLSVPDGDLVNKRRPHPEQVVRAPSAIRERALWVNGAEREGARYLTKTMRIPTD